MNTAATAKPFREMDRLQQLAIKYELVATSKPLWRLDFFVVLVKMWVFFPLLLCDVASKDIGWFLAGVFLCYMATSELLWRCAQRPLVEKVLGERSVEDLLSSRPAGSVPSIPFRKLERREQSRVLRQLALGSARIRKLGLIVSILHSAAYLLLMISIVYLGLGRFGLLVFPMVIGLHQLTREVLRRWLQVPAAEEALGERSI